MRRATTAHSGELWARLNQLIKVESPITLEGIRHWCSDVRASDLTTTLNEMCAARKISVIRQWSQGRMIETYHYGDGVSVNLFDDGETRPRPRQRWRQAALVI